MKLSVDIEISIEEIKFLKKYFDNNRIPNQVWIFSESGRNENNFKILQEKGIILIDSINNCYLTRIGKEIFKQISRENIIDKLIE